MLYEVITLPEKEWNLAMVDLKMPGMDGIQLMDEIRKIKPETIVIIMTAYATVDTAVQAMKKVAYDYIVKPFNPEDVITSYSIHYTKLYEGARPPPLVI